MNEEEKFKDKKDFFGLPMQWDRKNMFKNFWNTESDELFPPKTFGIGWDVNLHAVMKSLGFIKKNK